MNICAPWITAEDVLEHCSDDCGDQDLGTHIDTATEILFLLSGQQFPGICEGSYRPCQTDCGCFCHTSTYSGHCGCSPPRVDLGPVVISSVTEVKIDGVVISPATYRLDEERFLTRVTTSGVNPGWPCSQDLAAPETDPNTFIIKYTTGEAPPAGGKQAAAKFACELALASAGSSHCKLPNRISSVVRQGVTISVDLFGDGRTGIFMTDMWLKSINPAGLTHPTKIVSPEDLIGVRT